VNGLNVVCQQFIAVYDSVCLICSTFPAILIILSQYELSHVIGARYSLTYFDIKRAHDKQDNTVWCHTTSLRLLVWFFVSQYSEKKNEK